jgi:hypothetical protein
MTDEKKGRASVLDTLSFSLLDQETLVRKLAHLFIGDEPGIVKELGRRARGNWEVNEKNVAPWLRTIYTPPHGSTKAIVKLIVAEVALQKAKQAERAKAVAYRATYGKVPKLAERRNSIAATLYDVGFKDYRGEVEKAQHSCAFLSSYGDWLVGINSGGYYRANHLFVRNRRTGVSTLTSMGRNTSISTGSLSQMLWSMLSEAARDAIFKGSPVIADFDALTINIGGRIERFSVTDERATSRGGTKVSIETKLG